jgi:hypothetical protein
MFSAYASTIGMRNGNGQVPLSLVFDGYLDYAADSIIKFFNK